MILEFHEKSSSLLQYPRLICAGITGKSEKPIASLLLEKAMKLHLTCCMMFSIFS